MNRKKLFALALFAALSANGEAASIKAFIVPANNGRSGEWGGQILSFDSRSGAFEREILAGQSDVLVQGLTYGSDGYLFGSFWDGEDSSNPRGQVLRVSMDGQVNVFAAPGSGGLFAPVGLSFGPDGSLYVANNSGDNRGNVLRFNGVTGSFTEVFASGLRVPQDLAFGPSGNLYVTNGVGDSVSLFDGNTGESLGFFVSPGAFGLDGPVGLAFGPSEDLYVASAFTAEIFRFNGESGALVGTFNLRPYYDTVFDQLLDVSFSPNRRLIASVRREDTSGTVFLQLDPESGELIGRFASTPPFLSFNTGMLFVDQACSSLGAVKGGASGCFAPKPIPEGRVSALLGLGLAGLGLSRRRRAA